ncbi:MAG: hypothetical protein RL456_2213 [Pseudomonadota bacterium]
MKPPAFPGPDAPETRAGLHRRDWLARAGAAALALGAARLAAAAPRPVLSFGVVPQQSATELARVWIPVLAMLSERAGLDLRFATAPDIPTFERRMAAGLYDVAYMNPYHYSVFARRPGYVAFAREKGRMLRGLVVVRRDSPVQDLRELAGRPIAFPAPAAFAATVLVRAEFARMNVPIEPRYVNSHESVYLNVAHQQFDAGGGINRTLQTMDPAVRAELRVLWQTREYTPHAFAAHPRVPPAARDALRGAMLGADASAANRPALDGIGFKGFEEARDADWNDVRALGLDLLSSLLKS